jgi:hypothetical protein
MKWFALIAALTLATALPAQTLPAGPQVLSFYSPVDDTDQPYAIYIPDGYDPARPWPLVVSLHGAFSNHRVNLRRVFGQGNREGEPTPRRCATSPPCLPSPFSSPVPSPAAPWAIAASPKPTSGPCSPMSKSRFHVDEDRTYLTGLSMGGGGTLELGLKRPGCLGRHRPPLPRPARLRRTPRRQRPQCPVSLPPRRGRQSRPRHRLPPLVQIDARGRRPGRGQGVPGRPAQRLGPRLPGRPLFRWLASTAASASPNAFSTPQPILSTFLGLLGSFRQFRARRHRPDRCPLHRPQSRRSPHLEPPRLLAPPRRPPPLQPETGIRPRHQRRRNAASPPAPPSARSANRRPPRRLSATSPPGATSMSTEPPITRRPLSAPAAATSPPRPPIGSAGAAASTTCPA